MGHCPQPLAQDTDRPAWRTLELMETEHSSPETVEPVSSNALGPAGLGSLLFANCSQNPSNTLLSKKKKKEKKEKKGLVW